LSRLSHGAALLLLLSLVCVATTTGEASGQELHPCLASDECPTGMRCHWGLCLSGIILDTEVLFQISILDIPDLTLASGTLWLRNRIGEHLTRSLNETGVFRAVRHGGAFPPDTRTLFQTMERGSAYAVSAHLGAFDENGATLNIEVFDAERGEMVVPLGGQLKFDASGRSLGREVQRWANGVVEHFTGRPGILGARLACVRRLEKGVKEVFVAQYGQTEMRQVTEDRSLALLPSWTVDGRVAFTSYRDGRPKIFLEGQEEPFVAYEGMSTGLAWSSDGATAAVTLSKDGNSEVYLLEGTTGEVRARLTYHPGIDTSPTWSPDDGRLAFVSDREGTPQLFVMNADGTGKERLPAPGGYNTSPDWHPFGPHLVYAGRVGGEFQVFRFDMTDGTVLQLTNGPGDAEAPSWSPDGSLIAFVWRRKAAQNIFVMKPDGSGLRQFTFDDGPYFAPVWEPAALCQ
jgi:TolB protein